MRETIRIVESPAYEIAEPPTLGTGYDDQWMPRHREAWAATDTRAREITIRRTEGVLVLARGLALGTDGRALPETTPGIDEQVIRESELRHAELRAAAAVLPGRHVLAARPGLTCYGHVVVEMLPNAWITRDLGAAPLIGSTAPPMREVHTAILSRLGYSDWTATNGPVVVEDLLTVDGFAVTARYLSPLIRMYAAALHEAPTPGTRRLFMPRRPEWARNITDVEAVQDVLTGFETFHPEDVPVDAQIDAMQGVRTIVSVMGSSLTNVLFAPPGARVLALAPDVMTDTFFWRLCALLGHEYAELRCATTESEKSSTTGRPLDRDIVVDTRALADWVATVS